MLLNAVTFHIKESMGSNIYDLLQIKVKESDYTKIP